MIYPWQVEQWQQFSQRKSQQRLPHALLLSGMQGMGKAHFAEAITHSLLCHKSSANTTKGNAPSADCDCHACSLLNGRAHPNVLWIEPEKAGQAIKVDPIREVTEFVNQTSLQSGYRIVIINPANQMNVNAANALLKTLEEPSAGALLILISHQDAGLPATILSRCQRLAFPLPSQKIASDWLRNEIKQVDVDPELLLSISQGGPLSVLTLLQDDFMSVRASIVETLAALAEKKIDPVTAANHVQSADLMAILNISISLVTDCMRLHMKCDQALLINRDIVMLSTMVASRSTSQDMLHFLALLNDFRHQVVAGINLNKALLIETIMINWRECF